MASFLTPTAEYGQFAKRYYESADEMAKQRREQERLALLARQQAASEKESAARIGLLQAQESRQAAAFAEQQKKAAALRAAMSESIPEEPTSIVRGPAAASGTPGLRVPARRGEPIPGMMRLGGPTPEDLITGSPGTQSGAYRGRDFYMPSPTDIPVSGAVGTPSGPSARPPTPPAGLFPQTEAARAALLKEQRYMTLPAKIGAAARYIPTLGAAAASDIAESVISPVAPVVSEFWAGLRGTPSISTPTPAAVEGEAAGVTPPAPSAAEEVARTPVDKPVEVADVGRRLYTLEKAQVARARKELSAQRKEVVRMMKQAQAVEDLTAFNNARLLLLKIDGQIEDKNRVDQLLSFRDSTGTKTLEPLAKQLNELTQGRVEIEALEDGTFNLYDNGTDPDTPFTPKPLTREELWNQLDLAFNNDRIAKEQAAIAAQAEAQAKLSEEYAKAMGKGEAERQLNQKYPQADYVSSTIEAEGVGRIPAYVDRTGRNPPFAIMPEPVIIDGKPVLDPLTKQPRMRLVPKEIPMPRGGAVLGAVPPGTVMNPNGILMTPAP